MAALTSMKNIGKEMETKLKAVGITTAEELINTGSTEAFYKLKKKYPNVCLVHLYVLEGAISDIEYNALSEATKNYLKEFNNNLL